MTTNREDLETGQFDFGDIAEPGAERIKPIHPGRLLMTEWLEPLGISAYRLAKDLNVPPNRVTEIVNGNRGITAETALRLARYFGTDAQSWINLQAAYDIEVARYELDERIKREVHPRAA
jgi:addiction module HigA family antidote